MRKLKYLLLFAGAMLSGSVAFGQRWCDNNLVYYTDSIGDVYLDMPLLTLPSQRHAYATTGGFFSSYMNPGMENSLAYSMDFYTAAHYGLKKAIRFKNGGFWQIFLQRLAISAFDVVVLEMPLGASWLHEEYHRGVMSQYGVNSFNEVLLFNIGTGSIAVSHETDEDMSMLCDEHHADFVRLMSAGHEAVVDLNRTMQSNEFFYHQNLDNEVMYWMHTFQNFLYMVTCATGSGDAAAIERNGKENTVESRDFTGMDMNAWVHALCNPDLPYAARGTHPSGVGINRYILYDDISQEGKDYLKRQMGLDVLNFISPMMFGFSRFRLAQTENGDCYGNFAFRHYLTSFGSDASLDLYLQFPRCNLYTTLHAYGNLNNNFGGLEVGVVDFPIMGTNMRVGATLMGWIQPDSISFTTSSGMPGALITARLAWHNRFMEPYAELGWKSKGWVAGNVNLDYGFFLKAGIRWQIAGNRDYEE